MRFNRVRWWKILPSAAEAGLLFGLTAGLKSLRENQGNDLYFRGSEEIRRNVSIFSLFARAGVFAAP
ncbi:MAG: hypothetical protein WA510_01370, partial [Acidobacteriaceae bacterium]